MASSVTVIPSVGHGLVTAQDGASTGYDAIDDRRFWGAGLTEGVLSKSSDAWKVTQDTGLNMAVKINADVDGALVHGDAIVNQGLYYVAPHSGDLVLDVSAAHASLARIDRVILEIKDHQHDGSGLSEARCRVVAGTPAGSPSAPALPDSAISLATLAVAALATAITTAHITDARAEGGGASSSTDALVYTAMGF